MKNLTAQQALELIEMAVFDLDKRDSQEKLLEITSDIYRVAHAHNKKHSCHRVHKDWRKEAAKTYPELKKVIGG